MENKQSELPEDPKKWRRAVLRLILGQLQIIGATAGLYFLAMTGGSKFTLWTVSLTGSVTALSLYLFRVVWPDKH